MWCKSNSKQKTYRQLILLSQLIFIFKRNDWHLHRVHFIIENIRSRLFFVTSALEKFYTLCIFRGVTTDPPLIRVLGGGVDLFGDLKSSIGPNYMKSKYDILLSIPDLIVEISSQKIEISRQFRDILVEKYVKIPTNCCEMSVQLQSHTESDCQGLCGWLTRHSKA